MEIWKYGKTIQTGITWRKSLVVSATTLAGGLLLKIRSYVKHVRIVTREKKL